MNEIYVLGAGGFAREVARLIRDINDAGGQWEFRGFVVPERERVGAPIGPSEVVCTEAELVDRRGAVAVGVGNSAVIERMVRPLIEAAGLTFPNLVHPNVIWGHERIAIGQGNVVCAGDVLTTDISIGSFNILNVASTYGHDARIGNHCVVNPGVRVSGGVSIGDNCLVGTNAVILQNLTIGAGATVGAGAVVTKDVQAGATVVGIPAKEIGRRS